jgi:hypothetical protein
MKRSALLRSALLVAVQVSAFLITVGVAIDHAPAGSGGIHPLWAIFGVSLAIVPLVLELLAKQPSRALKIDLVPIGQKYKHIDASRLGRGMRRQRLLGQSIIAFIIILVAFSAFLWANAAEQSRALSGYVVLATAILIALHLAYTLRAPGTILLGYIILASLVFGVTLQVFVLWIGWLAIIQGPSAVAAQWSPLLLSSAETILATIVFMAALPINFWTFQAITFYGEEYSPERRAVRRPLPSSLLSVPAWWFGLQPFLYNAKKISSFSNCAFLFSRLGILVAALSAFALANFSLVALLPPVRGLIDDQANAENSASAFADTIAGGLTFLAREVTSLPDLERALANNTQALKSFEGDCHPPPNSEDRRTECNRQFIRLYGERRALENELGTGSDGASMVVVIFAATLLLGFGGLLWWFFNAIGRRLAVRTYLAEREEDKRAPFVFLRSFRDDSGRRGLNSIDALLYERATPIGPVVAIGRPGVEAPFGAARAFVSTDAWKDEAVSLIREAKGLCVVVDESDGIRWELEKIREHNAQRKALYFFSTTATADEKMRILEREFPGQVPERDMSSIVAFRCSSEGVILCSGRRRNPDDAEAIIAQWLAECFAPLAKQGL